jgi:large subunit ribosomal protein L29
MKTKDLRDLNDEELIQKLDDFKEELFNLRFQKSLNRLENPMRIRFVKRDIAKVKTIQTERKRGNNDR